MKIGIDFDGVLFNTEKFKKKLFEEVPNFDETYEDAKGSSGFYSSSLHAEILDIPLNRILDSVGFASECLYSDLHLLKEIDEELWIVSRGDSEFQAEKIRQSGAVKFVEGFTVVQKRPKDAETGIDALVDDTKDELKRTDLQQSRLFHMKRPENSMQDVVNWTDGL